MKIDRIPKDGTTRTRKRFWDNVAQWVEDQSKTEGRNVSVQEHQGLGTIVNVVRERGGSPPEECCGIDELNALGISSFHFEWDFHITCRCDETYHLERTWTLTTPDDYPPPDGTFLFRCSPFTNTPEFVAGSTDPIIGYVYGDGIRLPYGDVMSTWITADIDINTYTCDSFRITPGFTTSIVECFESPFGIVSGSPFVILFTDLMGTHNYTFGPIECPHDPGFFYDAAWTMVVS